MLGVDAMANLIQLRSVYKIYAEGRESEVRALDGVSLAEPEVYQWILASLKEEIEPILGGIQR